MIRVSTEGDRGEDDAAIRGRWLTVPNALTSVRLLGVPVLLWLAHAGRSEPFPWLLGALFLTDWLDGKLAVALRQSSALGARLDSVADALLYGALLPCAWWLRPDLARTEWPWAVALLAAWALAVTVSLAKFGRLPSHHTRLAKTSWLLAMVGALWLFTGRSPWPVRAALLAGTLTNLESTAITLVTRSWRRDVGSLLRVLRTRGGEEAGP